MLRFSRRIAAFARRPSGRFADFSEIGVHTCLCLKLVGRRGGWGSDHQCQELLWLLGCSGAAFLAGAAAAALAGRDAKAGFPIFDLSSPQATVNGITASPATGSFGSSQVIHFTVNFNQVVNVAGHRFSI